MVRALGLHSVDQREVFVLPLGSLKDFAWPEEFDFRPFACLCALDARAIPNEDLEKICSRLVEVGCVYFCAWGPGCERVHDTMDQAFLGDSPTPACQAVLMTTWHA